MDAADMERMAKLMAKEDTPIVAKNMVGKCLNQSLILIGSNAE
jgi:hypothetical protein